MTTNRTPFPLRGLLRFDAATCAAMGLALAFASGPIARATQLPPALLFPAGLALLPVALFMAAVASRPVLPRAGVWIVIAGNLTWVAASFLLLAAGWVAPNALGAAFLIAQALVVAALAWMELSALRDAEGAAA